VGEIRDVIRDAVETLPAAQRLVITLRDIEVGPPTRHVRASS